MFKKLSLCAVLLASAVIGPLNTQDPGQAPNQAPPPMLPEVRSQFSAVAPAALAAIATWVSEQFDLPLAGQLPRVELIPPARLVAIRYRGLLLQPPQAAAAEQAMLDAQRDTLAVYDEATRTIYLPEGWRGASPAEVSVLVHEMVHHLQSLARVKFECPQEREKIAYMAQDRWLGLSGRSLEREFGIDPFTRLVRTGCMG